MIPPQNKTNRKVLSLSGERGEGRGEKGEASGKGRGIKEGDREWKGWRRGKGERRKSERGGDGRPVWRPELGGKEPSF